jgi:hypothetical protein
VDRDPVEGYNTRELLVDTSMGKSGGREVDNESMESRLYMKPVLTKKWQTSKGSVCTKRQRYLMYVNKVAITRASKVVSSLSPIS